MAIRELAADLEENSDAIQRRNDKREVIGRLGTAYVLAAVFLAVVAGSSALTLLSIPNPWQFPAQGRRHRRPGRRNAGSLELILSVREKGSQLILALGIMTFASCLVVHVFLSQARARMIAEAVGSQAAAVVTIDGVPGEKSNPSNQGSFSEDMLHMLHILNKAVFRFGNGWRTAPAFSPMHLLCARCRCYSLAASAPPPHAPVAASCGDRELVDQGAYPGYSDSTN